MWQAGLIDSGTGETVEVDDGLKKKLGEAGISIVEIVCPGVYMIELPEGANAFMEKLDFLEFVIDNVRIQIERF